MVLPRQATLPLLVFIYLASWSLGEQVMHKKKTCLSVVAGSRKRNPIAVEAKTFTDLIEHGRMFIDKTLMIEEVLRYRSFLKVIGRPSGWGKTINLDMIKTFVEIEVDENGKKQEPHWNTRNYRLFRYGELKLKDGHIRKLEKPLLVSRNLTFLNESQGRHPVVYLDFSQLKPNNYEEFESGIVDIIAGEFRRHNYILKVMQSIIEDPATEPKVRSYHEEDVERWTKLTRKNVKPSLYEDSLWFLCEMLWVYYDETSVILMNDYEGPLKHLLLLERNSPNRNKAHVFYNRVIVRRGWQKNIHYLKAVICGTVRAMEGNMNVDIFEALDRYHDPNFHEYHGFSKQELEEIFHHLELPTVSRKYILDHYHGYRYGLKKFANSLSVAKFLANVTDNRWNVDTTMQIYFRQLLPSDEWQHFLLTMMTGSTCNMRLPKDLLEFGDADFNSMNDLGRHYEDVLKRRNFTFSQHGAFLNTSIHNAKKLLCASGFFTLALQRELNVIEMKIPNLQVREYMKEELLVHFNRQFGFTSEGDRFEGTPTQRLFCDELNKFLRTKDKSSAILTSKARNFFFEMPHLRGANETMTTRRLIFKPENLIFSALNFVTLFTDTSQVIRGAIPYNVFNNTRQGAITVLRYDKHIAVIEFTLGQPCATFGFDRTENWRNLVENYTDLGLFETVKRVAINYHPFTTEAQVKGERSLIADDGQTPNS